MTALEAAHERIADLEAALAGRRRPRPELRWRWGYAATLFALALAGGIAVLDDLLPGRTTSSLPAAQTASPIPPGSLRLVADEGPSVEGDLVVVRATRAREDALHVVGLDRRTLAVRWRSAAMRRGTSALALTPRVAVLLDERGKAHVLDRATGEERSAFDVVGTVGEMLPLGDRELAILPAQPTVFGHERVVDAEDGTFLRALHEDPPCRRDRAAPCIGVDREARIGKLYPRYRNARLHLDGADQVTLVEVGGAEFAVGWRADGTAAWRRALAGGVAPAALANGRLLRLYPTPGGPHRLAAYAVHTGKPSYDVETELALGSTVHALTAAGDDAYVMANGALYVFDATDGSLKKRLTSF